MPWYYYPAAGYIICLAAVTVAMFLPMRIFMRILRKNNIDHAALAVKFGPAEIRLLLLREPQASQATLAVKLWRWKFRVPVLRKKIGDRETLVLRISRWEYSLPVSPGRYGKSGLEKAPELFKRTRPFLKKMQWKDFDLEVIFGLEDAAVTGMAAGGCWLLGGVLSGMLRRYFKFAAAPRINIIPRFDASPFQLRWEGELSMALFRWLKLLLVTRKIIGGAVSGSSSH